MIGWTLDGDYIHIVTQGDDEYFKPRWRGIKGLDGSL